MRRVALTACAGALGLSVGCDPLSPRVFVASAWNEDEGCLERAGAVDVMDDEDPEVCNDAVRCWRSPEGELYATQACEAPLGWERIPPSGDDECRAALNAWERGDEGRCDGG